MMITISHNPIKDLMACFSGCCLWAKKNSSNSVGLYHWALSLFNMFSQNIYGVVDYHEKKSKSGAGVEILRNRREKSIFI